MFYLLLVSCAVCNSDLMHKLQKLRNYQFRPLPGTRLHVYLKRTTLSLKISKFAALLIDLQLIPLLINVLLEKTMKSLWWKQDIGDLQLRYSKKRFVLIILQTLASIEYT